MPNYAKNVIYTIQCKDPNITETYASYTTNLISRRRDHKSECNNPNDTHYNNYLNYFIRENGGWDNWEVVWQYNYPCENTKQAILEKTKFIKEHNCKLNRNCLPKEKPKITASDFTEDEWNNLTKELEKRLEKKREKDRVRQRVENLTQEQREKQNAKARVENMTEEQKAKKKERNKKYREKQKLLKENKVVVI